MTLHIWDSFLPHRNTELGRKFPSQVTLVKKHWCKVGLTSSFSALWWILCTPENFWLSSHTFFILWKFLFLWRTDILVTFVSFSHFSNLKYILPQAKYFSQHSTLIIWQICGECCPQVRLFVPGVRNKTRKYLQIVDFFLPSCFPSWHHFC